MASSACSTNGVVPLSLLGTGNAAKGTYCRGPSGTINNRLPGGRLSDPNSKFANSFDREISVRFVI